jgi:hypothetical protein
MMFIEEHIQILSFPSKWLSWIHEDRYAEEEALPNWIMGEQSARLHQASTTRKASHLKTVDFFII